MTRTRNWLAAALTVCATVLWQGPATAATYAWNLNATSWWASDWPGRNGTPLDSWGTGIDGVFPNTSGDVVNLTKDVTMDPIVYVLPEVTAGTVTIGDPNASNKYTLSGNSDTSFMPNAGLLFLSDPSGTATIGRTAGNAGDAISVPLRLVSNLTVNQQDTTNLLTISSAMAETGAARSLTKEGAGVLVLSGGDNNRTTLAKVSYTGGTIVANGTLRLGQHYSVSEYGGLTLTGSGQFALSTYTQAVLALTSAAGTSSVIGTGSLRVNGADSTTFAGALGLTGADTFTFIKGGSGTLTLAGTNAYAGATTLRGGTLRLDYDAANTNKLATAATLTLAGGTLEVKGSTTATTAQAVGAVTADVGASVITVNNGTGQTATLSLGAIARTASAGATLDVGGTGAANTTTAVTNTNGILGTGVVNTGGFVTVGNDWATVAGGNIVALSSYSAFGTTGATQNQLLTGTGTTGGAYAANSLKLNTSAAGQSLSLGNGILTLTNNGVLFVGANDYAINSGGASGQLGANSAEVNIHTKGSGVLTLNAKLGTSARLVKAGSGTLVLAANNPGTTFVNDGLLQLGAANLFNGTTGAAVTLRKGVLDLNGYDAVVASLNLGDIGGTTSTVQTGTGTLTLGGNVTYNSAGALVGNPGAAAISGKLNLGTTTAAATYLRTFAVNAAAIGNGIAATDLTVSAAVAGPGSGVSVSGYGRMALTAANSYTGPTVLSGNNTTLIINSDASLGTPPAVAHTGHLLLTDPGYSPGGLAVAETMTLNANRSLLIGSTTILDVAAGKTLTYNGTLNPLFTSGYEGRSSILKNGSGTLVLGGRTNLTGVNNSVNAGTLRFTADNLVSLYGYWGIQDGATLDLNGTNQSFGVLGNGPTGTITSSASYGAALLTVGGGVYSSGSAFRGMFSDTTGLGTGTGTLSLLVSGGPRKGGYVLNLEGPAKYSGPTTLASAALSVSHRLDNSAKLPATQPVTLAGGTLYLTGNAAAASSETVNGLNAKAGLDMAVVEANATYGTTLNLGAITRDPGAVVNFGFMDNGVGGSGAGKARITTTTTNQAGSILGGWAISGPAYGGLQAQQASNWAYVDGSGYVRNFAAYNMLYSAANMATWASTHNVSNEWNTGYATLTASKTINSIRFYTQIGYNNDLTLADSSVTLQIQSGGILQTWGGAAGTISGGNLTSGGPEMFFHLQANNMTVNSVIQDKDGSTPLRLVAALRNNTTLTLGGTNSYTGGTAIYGDGYITFSDDTNLGTAPASPTPGHIVISGWDYTSGANTTRLRLGAAAAASVTLNANRGIAIGPPVGSGMGAIEVVTSKTLNYGGVIANLGAGSGSFHKYGVGTLVLSGASTYSGQTWLDSGTIQLSGGDNRLPYGTDFYFSNAAAAVLDLNGCSQTFGAFSTNRSARGTVTSATPATLTILGAPSVGLDTMLNGANTTISGALSLVKDGPGQAKLSGAFSYTGSTTVKGGLLMMTETTDAADKLSDSNPLILAGGTFYLVGSGTNTEVVGGLSISPGESTLILEKGSTITLNVGAISRSAGGVLNFVRSNADASTSLVTTSTTMSNGILPAYLTTGYWSNGMFTGAVNWARWNVSRVEEYTSGYVNDSWAAANNTTVTANSSPASGSTTNSLRFAAPGAYTVTLAGANIITTGGIMNTALVGDNLSKITGGSLTSGTGTELIVHQANYTNNLEIGSNLTDNGGTAIGLTKAGLGKLILSGTNSYTGNTLLVTGTLLVNGSHTGGGNYVVNPGTTLGGTGSIGLASGKTVSVVGTAISPATLSPGASIGTLTVGTLGNLNTVILGDYSTLPMDLAADGSCDKLAVNGDLDLSSALDQLTFAGAAPENGAWYTIATFTGSLIGTPAVFSRVVWPETMNVRAFQYNSNDISVFVIPEPTTALLLALAGGGLLRRRRSR